MAAMIALLAGLATLDQGGVNWDERCQREDNGKVNWSYIFDREHSVLLTGNERYHGPVFELLLVAPEAVFPHLDTRTIFLIRHALTFLMFWAGAWALGCLLRRRFNTWIATAGFVLFMFAPRMWGDAAHNSKDAVFAAWACIQAYALWRTLETPSKWSPLLLGVALGLCTSVRILGVAFFITAAVAIVWRYPDRSLRSRLFAFTLMCGAFVLTTYATWPVLWDSPKHFMKAFIEMSAYHYDEPVWFHGEAIRASQLPWFYLPTMIAVTTPPATLLLAGLGLVLLISTLVKKPWTAEVVFDGAMVANGLGLLAAIILMKGIVYDGWRHVFFVFPTLIYLGCLALAGKQAWRSIQVAGVAACALTMWHTARLHPHANVYFNRLAGATLGDAQKRYELDYWGLSARMALKHLLARCHGPIGIQSYQLPIVENGNILPVGDRERLRFGSDKKDVLVTVIRGQLQPKQPIDPLSFVVDGAVLIQVENMSDVCR